MGKRIGSIWMAFCMILTLLPQMAWAADWTGWTALTASDTTLSGGKYYLSDDLSITTTIEITGTVTLDLNGNVLQMTGNDDDKDSVIKITSDGNLTLQDSDPTKTHSATDVKGGMITGGYADSSNNKGGGVYNGGTFTMNGGTISGYHGSSRGGGVCNDITFTMNGGRISGYNSLEGGGVYNGGTFTMENGTISGNHGGAKGSGVCNDGTFTMKNGAISGNKPIATEGGGVYNGGTFTMENGTISGNLASTGGGVYNGGTFNMNDGTISGNDSDSFGGGVYNASTFTMKGGNISGNKATYYGSGVTNGYEKAFNADGGTVDDTVQNSGTIDRSEGATGSTTFSGEVTNTGTISGGEFSGTVKNDGGTISNGTFSGEVTNTGTISDGTFSGEVTNTGTISSGIFYGGISDSGTISRKKYTVTFHLNDDGTGTAPASQVFFNQTTKAQKPTDPTWGSCTFGGWYTESACENEYDFDSVVESDIELYAKWTLYTVTFDANGGTISPTSAETDINGKLASMPTPTRSGYIFDGWFDAASGGTKIDKNTVFSANTTLYAHWTAIPTTPSGASGSSSGGSSVRKYAVAASASSAAHGKISISPKNAQKGATVTISIMPEEGYFLETLTILDANGAAIPLTDKGNGTYTFQMPNGNVSVEAAFVEDAPAAENPPMQEEDTPPAAEPAEEKSIENPFADVSVDAYYYEAVLWAIEHNITGGVDATHFAPQNSCSRAQLVTFLWRAAGCPQAGAGTAFADVQEDSYYADAVQWAASLGIVSGYENGLFGADGAITREQVAAILYRFAKAMGDIPQTDIDTNLLSYQDAEEVSAYAVEALQWATGAGVMQGADGKLLPRENCTRAEIVAMLYRLLGK